MKIASIDIGSNTVILLIAEVDKSSKTIKNIFDLQFIPRIGEGLSQTNKISDNKISQLQDILSHYKKIAENYLCSEIIAIGTNAFRMASNSKEIVKLIDESPGLKIKIISGDDEAEYSFIGATYEKLRSSKSLVIDIGGGSTEISVGTNCKITHKKSLPIGVVTLKEKYFFSSTEKFNMSGAEDEIMQHLSLINFVGVSIDNAIAIAGTPTTLATIKKNLTSYDEQKVEGDELNVSDLNDFVKELSTLTNLEIKSLYKAVINNREDLLPVFSIGTPSEILKNNLV
jgi:exopolyphosphatase/guanosine-5'-triphosphate,3'-diphosphate pyrophosphatase